SSRLSYTWAVARAVAVGFASLFTVLFLLKIQFVSRAVIVVFAGLDFIGLACLRIGVIWYFHKSLRRRESFRRVLIVGSGGRARRMAQTLRQHTDWGISIVGHLDPDPTRIGERVLDSSVVGTLGDISSVLKENVIDDVILAIPRAMIPDVDKIAQACEEEGVN